VPSPRFPRPERARRGRRDNALGIPLACLFLGGLIVCALFYGGLVPSGIVPLEGFRSDDGFAQTRIGRILFIPTYGNLCRQVEFSNQTWKFGNDRLLPCEEAARMVVRPIEQDVDSTDRLTSIRDAFVNRKGSR
jgi:hypothetical protein